MVGDASIVREGELPPTWGLLVPDPSPRAKGKLRIAVAAPKLTSGPMPRHFLASILRNVAAAKAGMVSAGEITELESKAREVGRQQAERQNDTGNALALAQRDLADLKKMVETFEAASGIAMDTWSAGKIGEAVKIVHASGALGALDRLAHMQRRSLDELKEMGKRIEAGRAELAAADAGKSAESEAAE